MRQLTTTSRLKGWHCECSEAEDGRDDGMADLQKTLARVVTNKKETARQQQLAVLRVCLHHAQSPTASISNEQLEPFG